MDTNEIKFRLDEAKKIVHLLEFHKKGVDKILELMAEKFYSDILDKDGNKQAKPVDSFKIDLLKERFEYYYYAREVINIVAELRAKEALVKEYQEHYDRTLKEENKTVSDKEILAAIQEMVNLNLSGKLKQASEALADDFRSGRVVGLENRFLYLESIKNFIEVNK